MSENNYGALMMKLTVGVSDDINAILSPGIYPIPAGNDSSPVASGGVLIVHAGEYLRRSFLSDLPGQISSRYNPTQKQWEKWKFPGFQNCIAFTTPGLTNWAVPDELKNGRKAFVIVIGGGASGSIGSITAGGSGGAAGGECRKLVDLTGIDSVAVTIGEGGAPVTTASTNGKAGGTSSFGTVCSAIGAPQSNISSGQTGGDGVGGDINIRGAASTPSVLCSYVGNLQDRAGGNGGGYGGGAAQNGSAQFDATAAAKRDATTPGSGGAGVAPYSGGATTFRSGAGAPGAVYIFW